MSPPVFLTRLIAPGRKRPSGGSKHSLIEESQRQEMIPVNDPVQWDPYNVDTLRNEKHVLIIGVSSFQGEVYISRVNHWDI